MSPAAPKRGELWWVNFDPKAGHEQQGRRPALVLSHESYNARTRLMICLAVTSRPKGYRTELPLPDGLGTRGVVLTSHVYTFDWFERQGSYIEHVPDALIEDAANRLAALISG